MRLVFGLVLLVGLGLAGFAVYMAQGYIAQYESALASEREALEQRVSVKEIYVAAKALRYGDELTPDSVKLIKFPEESLPEGAFLEESALFPAGAVGPRIVLRAVELNEPILSTKVTAPGKEAGVASFLTDGMRAFTINVDVTTGVAGFLNPGDRVDVFWSGSVGNQEVTKLIQSTVKIIGIDQSADQDRLVPTIARTVTVEVSPTQVAALAQAQATGRLSLALVGVADNAVVEGIEVDQRQLLGLKEEVVIEEEVKESCYVTSRKGGEVERIEVACPD